MPRTLAEPVAGGVAVPFGVWDSQLATYCDPRPYHDGTIRCLPSIDALVLLPEPRFADPSATIPVAIEPLAAPPAAGSLTGVSGGFAIGPFDCRAIAIQTFGRIGAQSAGTTYYDATGHAVAVPSGYGMFAIDTLPDDFVVLQEVRTELAGSIAVRELDGADGSRLFARDLYDIAHDVPVAIPFGGDRLLPPKLGAPSQTTHLAPPSSGVVSDYWCAHGDTIFAATDADGCDVSSLRFVSDAAQATYGVVPETATLYGCGYNEGTPFLVSTQTRFLEPCSTVSSSEWTPATPVVIGGGRLTASAYTIGAATYVRPPVTFLSDALLGITCVPRTASDGMLRCLPADQAAIAYADAACTSPVAVASSGTPTYALGGSLPSYWFPDVRGTITVYSVGSPRPASTTYYRTPEGCTPLVGWTSYDVGAAVAPSTFAALDLRDAP